MHCVVIIVVVVGMVTTATTVKLVLFVPLTGCSSYHFGSDCCYFRRRRCRRDCQP